MNIIIIYKMADLLYLWGSFNQLLLVAFCVSCFSNSTAIAKSTGKLSITVTLYHFIYLNNFDYPNT